MPHPPADLDLTVADVERLLAAQHPALLAHGALRHVAHGWDNDVFRLGDALAVRLPRREVAARLIEHEQRWLSELAARLPVPVPAPVAVGAPDDEYPWSWSVVPWFAGRRGLDLEPRERDAFAGQLAGILRELHVPAPDDAPRNPFRGVPLREREAAVPGRLAGHPELLPTWRAGLAAPEWEGAPVWLHGDLHPGNLVASRGRIAALIDFGDMCAGDPASDLAVAWLAFTPAGRDVFRAELGDLYDDATWVRARAWAAVFAAVVGDSGDPGFRAMAEHAVAQLT